MRIRKRKIADGKKEEDGTGYYGRISLCTIMVIGSAKESWKRTKRSRRKEKVSWRDYGCAWLVKRYSRYEQTATKTVNWWRKENVSWSMEEGRRVRKRNGKAEIYSQQREKFGTH